MSVFFTSDTHFGHEKVIGYSNRPFSNVEEMNNSLITNWNSIVSNNDDIYHLGDVAFHPKKQVKELLNRLNGKIHLVRGNHDNSHIRKMDRFSSVQDYLELKIQDTARNMEQLLVLMHYPIEVWNKRHYGSWHLHGHSHGTMPSPDWQARLDVGVDCHGYKPISYDTIVGILSKRIFRQIDSHAKKI